IHLKEQKTAENKKNRGRFPGSRWLFGCWNYAFKMGAIFKSYMKKAVYDMVRISAELHLKYDPDKPVQEILNGLEAYKTLDPCSGKPYKWNDEKQLLYSIGTDRVDNAGETNIYRKIAGSDYAIPVILYLR
ncbi:MAG: hypothetical protein JSV88_14425, partial [Candidatus Aminicenantes bacterium]